VVQSANPAAQVLAHPASEQRCPSGHFRPQPPQLALSVLTSTHSLSQGIDPDGQLASTQLPS
jgi:hypothetical protein